MKKFTRFAAILLSAAMAASLAACGNSAGQDSTGASDNSDSSSDASGKTTITMWHAMGGVNGEALQEMVDDFNASQDEVQVNIEYQGKL